MANQVILKKSSVVARAPVAADLTYGELAINYADGVLYYKKPDNTIGSISGTAGATTGVLTIGTGLTGTSFNGSSAVTIAIDSTVVTLLGTQSLSNKTFVAPILGTPASGNFSSGTFTWPTFNQNTTGTAAGLSSILAIASGGTGTATPSIVAGTNVTVSGTWPNQTIAASAANATTANVLTIGTGLTGTSFNGSTATTIAIDSTVVTLLGTQSLSNKTLVAPVLGTPASGLMTNVTGLPLTTGVTGILSVANGGTGTATPGLVAGTNVTVTGTWPNQTIASSGSSGGSGTSLTSIARQSYTATAGQTVFNIQYQAPYVDVFINGARLSPVDYTATNGTSITLVVAALVSDIVDLVGYNGVPVDGILPVITGGTGTATPSIVAGTNVTVTGTWPNQTIAASAANATTANVLTIGTGLTGTSFNGSSAVTIAIDSTVVTLLGTQSLSNKTFVAPILGTPISGNFSSGTFTWPTFNQNTTGTAATITGVYSGTITSAQITTGLGFTPYNATNPNLYIALASAITGYTAGADTALAATDTLLAALGKIQGQINAKGTGNGTVTSVAGTGTVSGLTLTGTVTATGNLTLGGTLAVSASDFASQTANYVLASPNGTAGTPVFRALVASDIPTLNQNTTGTAAGLSSILSVASGGTGTATPGIVAGTNVTVTGTWPNQTINSTASGGGAGTVTGVSIATANGLAGTVATATSTPVITLTTSVTGLLKGNGTAISAATSGTDYASGTSALATGILKTTTTTGALTIAVAADFPTLNQNTTGTAASLTTGRTIAITGDISYISPTFDGSSNVTAAATLATVNSNTGTFNNVTVNAKGLVTAASNVSYVPATRVVTVATGTSISINADVTDVIVQANTQATGTLTINAPTGTFVDGQKIVIRLSSTAVQTFSFNAIFAGSTDQALPTVSSSGGKYDYMGFQYNSAASKWQFLGKNFGF